MRREVIFLGTILVGMLLCGALLGGTQQSGVTHRSKGILDVTVVDKNGERLRDARVAVPGYRSTTGLAGTCRFSLLPGRYAVLISKSGYRGRRIYAGVRPDETTTLRVTLEKLPARRSPQK